MVLSCAGCFSFTALPAPKGPWSSRTTFVTVGVHLGQSSTSTITRHTRSDDLAIAVVFFANSLMIFLPSQRLAVGCFGRHVHPVPGAADLPSAGDDRRIHPVTRPPCPEPCWHRLNLQNVSAIGEAEHLAGNQRGTLRVNRPSGQMFDQATYLRLEHHAKLFRSQRGGGRRPQQNWQCRICLLAFPKP